STAVETPHLHFDLTLVFDGARELPAAELEEVVRAELVRLQVERPDRAALDDAAYALELYYRTRGFAAVQIDYALEEPPGAPPVARFTIVESARVRVRELTLEGAVEYGKQAAREKFGDMAAGGYYDADRLASDVDDLRADYLDKGFLRITVDDPRVD